MTKAHAKPRKPTYINLDPTDDPDQVCEAYRQIAIKSKLKSSMSHKRYFERQRAAEKSLVVKSEAKKIKAVRQQNNSLAKGAIARRTALRSSLIAGGYKVTPETVRERNTARADISILRAEGLDIVSIATGGNWLVGTINVSMWAIDHLKRIDGQISGTNTADIDALVAILKPYFLAGYLFTMGNTKSSFCSVTTAISVMRKDSLPICSIKNIQKESVLRGWALPSIANGLASVDAVQE